MAPSIDVARENALVEAASKLYPNLELECEGRRAILIGGHEDNIDSINVLAGGKVVLISEWVLEHCLRLPNSKSRTAAEERRITLASVSVVAYGNVYVPKTPLLQWCRDMCAEYGVQRLSPGTKLLVFWWDMEQSKQEDEKPHMRGRTWWPASYDPRYTSYGVWFSAQVERYDAQRATLHVKYEYNEPDTPEDGKLLLPLNYVHFGDKPPQPGGRAQVFPPPWKPPLLPPQQQRPGQDHQGRFHQAPQQQYDAPGAQQQPQQQQPPHKQEMSQHTRVTSAAACTAPKTVKPSNLEVHPAAPKGRMSSVPKSDHSRSHPSTGQPQAQQVGAAVKAPPRTTADSAAGAKRSADTLQMVDAAGDSGAMMTGAKRAKRTADSQQQQPLRQQHNQAQPMEAAGNTANSRHASSAAPPAAVGKQQPPLVEKGTAADMLGEVHTKPKVQLEQHGKQHAGSRATKATPTSSGGPAGLLSHLPQYQPPQPPTMHHSSSSSKLQGTTHQQQAPGVPLQRGSKPTSTSSGQPSKQPPKPPAARSAVGIGERPTARTQALDTAAETQAKGKPGKPPKPQAAPPSAAAAANSKPVPRALSPALPSGAGEVVGACRGGSASAATPPVSTGGAAMGGKKLDAGGGHGGAGRTSSAATSLSLPSETRSGGSAGKHQDAAAAHHLTPPPLTGGACLSVGNAGPSRDVATSDLNLAVGPTSRIRWPGQGLLAPQKVSTLVSRPAVMPLQAPVCHAHVMAQEARTAAAAVRREAATRSVLAEPATEPPVQLQPPPPGGDSDDDEHLQHFLSGPPATLLSSAPPSPKHPPPPAPAPSAAPAASNTAQGAAAAAELLAAAGPSNAPTAGVTTAAAAEPAATVAAAEPAAAIAAAADDPMSHDATPAAADLSSPPSATPAATAPADASTPAAAPAAAAAAPATLAGSLRALREALQDLGRVAEPGAALLQPSPLPHAGEAGGEQDTAGAGDAHMEVEGELRTQQVLPSTQQQQQQGLATLLAGGSGDDAAGRCVGGQAERTQCGPQQCEPQHEPQLKEQGRGASGLGAAAVPAAGPLPAPQEPPGAPHGSRAVLAPGAVPTIHDGFVVDDCDEFRFIDEGRYHIALPPPERLAAYAAMARQHTAAAGAAAVGVGAQGAASAGEGAAAAVVAAAAGEAATGSA